MRKIVRIWLLAMALCPIANALPLTITPSALTIEEIQTEKLSFRWKLMLDSLLSSPLPNDQAGNLTDQYVYTKLADMEAAGLMKASLEKSPWTDYYWPIYAGGIANRYNDSSYNAALDWIENLRFYQKNLGKGEVNALSPAEKYDLLIGDKNFTLTKAQIAEGKSYYERERKVAPWMGICHGWSPASYMMARPAHSVRLLAADGRTEIEFLPSDIKALASLLWAKTHFPTKIIGGRCNADEDLDDDRNDKDCLDTNPATWHIAVVNQIGVSKRSFIMDINRSLEVWNQPVYSYLYSYVNPRTGKHVDSIDDATIPLSQYRDDPYKQYRSRLADRVVGIAMSVQYVTEKKPLPGVKTDGPADDYHANVLYVYDLEIDRDGKIIGGEWHSQNHPDFLWTPTADARALSNADRQYARELSKTGWKSGEALPDEWKDAAKESSRYMQPLERIVRSVLDWASS